jgi:hypothetical protein
MQLDLYSNLIVVKNLWQVYGISKLIWRIALLGMKRSNPLKNMWCIPIAYAICEIGYGKNIKMHMTISIEMAFCIVQRKAVAPGPCQTPRSSGTQRMRPPLPLIHT